MNKAEYYAKAINDFIEKSNLKPCITRNISVQQVTNMVDIHSAKINWECFTIRGVAFGWCWFIYGETVYALDRPEQEKILKRISVVCLNIDGFGRIYITANLVINNGRYQIISPQFYTRLFANLKAICKY